MTAFDLVIFDCDGTLVESEVLNNQATSDVLAAIGLTQYTTDYCMETFIGWHQAKVWDVVGRENNIVLPSDMGQRYNDCVAALRPGLIRPAPHIEDVLTTLSQSHKLCVGSNGEAENVRGALEITRLDRFFRPEHIFTAHQVARPKPEPDLFLYAATQFGVPPDRALVIEDSVAGAKAGLAAGMTVFGYTGLSHKPDAQAKALADAGVKIISPTLLDILVTADGAKGMLRKARG